MGKSEVCIAERRPFRYSFAMRKLMMLAALLSLLVGCATAPRERTVTWDVLKWKSVDPAAAPLIDKSDVVLRGQDMRTRRTYSGPLTVEFEAQPEKPGAVVGMFSCLFIPANRTEDAEPEEFVAVMLQRSVTGEALVVMRRSGKPHHDETILGQPVTHQAGKPYPEKVEVTKDKLSVTLDGKTFVVPDAKVPYDKFRFGFSVVPVSDKWRIRNFAIR